MKLNFMHFCTTIAFTFAANTVQAASLLEAPAHSQLLRQGITASAAAAQQARSQSYLSLNQNRRLQLGQGLSFDQVLPTFKLGEETSLQGFSRINNDEQHLSMGVHFGDNLLNVMTGRGQGFSRLSNQYADLDPYYFHGGTTAPYQFNTIEWAHQFNDDLIIQFGQTSIDANQLEQRNTQFIGTSIGKFNAHYMQVQRDHNNVGEALSLGYEAGVGQFNWSALRHHAGGQTQQFSFDLNSSSRHQFGFSLSAQNNPLIEEETQHRILFRFSRAIGQHHRMQANGDTDTPKPKVNKFILIGGVAAVAGLALSSGSDSQDNNLRLPDQHAAARQVLNGINPRSVRENREYGGWIYRTPDNRYTSTRPIKGQLASVRIPVSLIPPGGKALASYHTHGSNDPRFVNEDFSPTDISSAESFKVDGYLATPGAKFLWYDHRKNRTTQLGSIATQ